MACRFNASVATGFDLDVRGVSYLVCQRRFGLEENSRDMVVCLRVGECAWQNSLVNCYMRVWLQRSAFCELELVCLWCACLGLVGGTCP